MRTKEYLQQPYYFDKLIKYKLEEIEKLENMLIYTSPQFKDNNNGARATRDEKICKLIDVKNQLQKEIDNMIAIKLNITKEIEEVRENKYKVILTLRYINFKSFEEIAYLMGYSYRHCVKLHKEALREIEKKKKLAPKCP